MASALIYAVRSSVETQPPMRRVIEKAGQTFLSGTPLMVDSATGAMVPWDGTSVTGKIAGISKEFGANLATTGVPQTLTYGSVQNQPYAVNIPPGAPLNDGRTGFDVACDTTIFFGQVGPSQTTAATDVGAQYGLTKDSDNHWYVDKTKTGGSAVLEVVKLDTVDTIRGVQFVFLRAAQQLVT